MQPGPPCFPYFVLYISGNDNATDFREPSPMIRLTMKATVNLSYYTQTTSIKRIELSGDQQSYYTILRQTTQGAGFYLSCSLIKNQEEEDPP